MSAAAALHMRRYDVIFTVLIKRINVTKSEMHKHSMIFGGSLPVMMLFLKTSKIFLGNRFKRKSSYKNSYKF